jgi:hypothetical protein
MLRLLKVHRLIPRSIRDGILCLLAYGALLYAANLGIAAPVTKESCHKKYQACQSRCAKRYDDFVGCINRTCNKQYDNCIASITPSSRPTAGVKDAPPPINVHGSSGLKPGGGIFDATPEPRGRGPSATGLPGLNAPPSGVPTAGTPPVSGGAPMPSRPTLHTAPPRPTLHGVTPTPSPQPVIR